MQWGFQTSPSKQDIVPAGRNGAIATQRLAALRHFGVEPIVAAVEAGAAAGAKDYLHPRIGECGFLNFASVARCGTVANKVELVILCISKLAAAVRMITLHRNGFRK